MKAAMRRAYRQRRVERRKWKEDRCSWPSPKVIGDESQDVEDDKEDGNEEEDEHPTSRIRTSLFQPW